MPEYTNVPAQVRHVDGLMLIPTVPTEVPEDTAKNNKMFQKWVKDELVKAGAVEVPAEVEQEAEGSADGVPNKAQQQAKSTPERVPNQSPKK